MSTTTSTAQSIPVPGAVDAPRTSPHGGPEILERARTVFHDILRLVADRAQVEATIESSFKDNDATADSEYNKARQSRLGKLDLTRQRSPRR